MIQKTINLYTFKELSEEAQKKAHEKWISNNDYYGLSYELENRLDEMLEENKMKLSEPRQAWDTHVLYNLSHCQGDGVYIQGTFIWKGYTVKVEQKGLGYSRNITLYKNDEEVDESGNQKKYNSVYAIIGKMCKELEKVGYDFIEYGDSLESFEQVCESNDYTFTSEGVMENA